jgi:hypothetical protein
MTPVYRPPLSLGNQTKPPNDPAKTGFPNPGPLIEGFENGAVFRVQCQPCKEESMSKMMKIELSMYGIAEVLHWCHDRNKGRVPGVDTAGFEKMKVFLAEKPQSGDYFILDQFWKKRVALDLTEDEVATIDRCLYDIPNFDSEPLPQIRHKFWPQQTTATH